MQKSQEHFFTPAYPSLKKEGERNPVKGGGVGIFKEHVVEYFVTSKIYSG